MLFFCLLKNVQKRQFFSAFALAKRLLVISKIFGFLALQILSQQWEMSKKIEKTSLSKSQSFTVELLGGGYYEGRFIKRQNVLVFSILL